MENRCKCDCECLHSSEVESAKQSLEKVESIEYLGLFFKNFADSTRLKIICVLDGVGSMCVCDIAVALNMTKSAISHQLKYLKQYGLIKSEKKGKEIFYSLADEHVKYVYELGLEHTKEIHNEKRV